MKKTLLICGALLAFAAPAFAQTLPPGIDLHWNDCFQGTGAPALDVSNACTANTGVVGTMVASFVPHGPLPLYEANLTIIDVETNAAALSPWWHMEAGGCATRVGKINCAATFTGAPYSTGPCLDFWGGGATPALLYAPDPIKLNRARIKAVAGVAENFAGAIDNSGVWYALNVTILKSGTLPLAACPGCQDAACFVLNQMNLSQPAPAPDDVLINPIGLPGASQYITYRGGTGTQLCPGATPTQNKTWGQLKSLYR